MNHGNAFHAHALGGFLQIQFRQNRHNKHVIVAVCPLGDKGLKHLGRVLAGKLRHMGTVHSLAFLVGIFVRCIIHLGTLQHAHGVGFCFFTHGKNTSFSVCAGKCGAPIILRNTLQIQPYYTPRAK